MLSAEQKTSPLNVRPRDAWKPSSSNREKVLLRGPSLACSGLAKVGGSIPGGAGQPKFNQLEMVTTFTYRPSLVKMDACNFELSW